MKMKKVTLESLYKNKKGIEVMIDVMERVMNLDPQNFEERICKEYIRVQSVVKVADLLNDHGYKIGKRKYIGKDVSEAIKEADGSEIADLANVLFKHNNTLQNGNTSFERKVKDFKELSSIK